MAGVADAGCKPDGGATIALVPSWRERTPNARSTAAIDVLDTLAPPLSGTLRPSLSDNFLNFCCLRWRNGRQISGPRGQSIHFAFNSLSKMLVSPSTAARHSGRSHAGFLGWSQQ